ncbi:Valine N-monooxygenase 1 [Linum perenne]
MAAHWQHPGDHRPEAGVPVGPQGDGGDEHRNLPHPSRRNQHRTSPRPTIAREMLKKQDAIFADRPVGDLGSRIISGGYLTTAVVPCNSQCHYKAGECVNLRTATQHYCGNVIRRMLLGKRFFGEATVDGGPRKEEVEHVKAAFTVLKYLYSFSVSDYLPWLRWLNVDGQGKIVKDANKVLREYQNPIIDERIRLWESGERKDIDDWIDVFITLKDSNGGSLLTPDEIKNQAAEIMIAGVDNPSNAVEWAMAELINQPNLLSKAIEEIDRVVGKDRLVQESDIGSLNYVKACAREAFRLHPMLPFNAPHVSTQDTTVAGYFIPKGSYALLSRYGLGRNPKAWTDPLKFDPNRHLHDADGGGGINLTEPDLRFISFSTMLLARLLQCFDWTSSTETVDLTEAEDELVLATPLTLFPTPRLAPHLYPTHTPR